MYNVLYYSLCQTSNAASRSHAACWCLRLLPLLTRISLVTGSINYWLRTTTCVIWISNYHNHLLHITRSHKRSVIVMYYKYMYALILIIGLSIPLYIICIYMLWQWTIGYSKLNLTDRYRMMNSTLSESVNGLFSTPWSRSLSIIIIRVRS